MNRTTLLWTSWLLTGATSATAAWLWKSQHSYVTEIAALRTRLNTPPAPPALPTKPPTIKADQPAADLATTGTTPPADGPQLTDEEKARRAQFDKAREALRQKESETRRAAKVHLLATRLNLSPEQEQIATAAFQKAHDVRTAMRENFKPGQPPDFALMEKMMRSDSVAAEEIRAQLSPEQQAEFDQVQQQERKDRAETQTNQRMSDMQQYLKMSEEQKDAVFNLLSQQAYANDMESQPPAKDFDEVRARMEASNAIQREQLAQILDETQLKAYDDLNATRSEMMNLGGGFGFGGGPPGGFGGGGPGRGPGGAPGGGGPPPAR